MFSANEFLKKLLLFVKLILVMDVIIFTNVLFKCIYAPIAQLDRASDFGSEG